MSSEATRDHTRDHTGRAMKFSDKFVESLKPTEKINDIREANGFGIRVLPSGVKTWFFIYRIDGKRRFMNLGHYPSIGLSDARKKYRAAYDLYEHGKDPADLADQAKEDHRKAPTVADLCTEYIERHAKKFKRSWETDERILNHDVIPAWGKRKAADITKRDVVLILERIVDRGSPIMANNTFAVLRKMFNWAIEKDILPHTPCTGVKPPAPKVSRDRVLSEVEIKTFWGNLDACAVSSEIRAALRLILATAQRPGEVIGMHTSEIDGEWWTIPAERAKNKKAHRVYLSPLARGIIAEAIGQARDVWEVPADQDYSGYVFPTPNRKKDQAIAPQALIVAVSRNLEWPVTDAKGKPLFDADGKPATVNKIGVEHFTPHDLRRTAATFMAEAGEMDEVIDAILNHAKQGVIKVYNQFKYDAQKRLALESWARKLASITIGTEGAKVLPMRRKVAVSE